jgi:PAS domain S-box-containing protein
VLTIPGRLKQAYRARIASEFVSLAGILAKRRVRANLRAMKQRDPKQRKRRPPNIRRRNNMALNTSAEARAGRRLEFLAGASHLLSSSLDYETTLASVARLAVPEVADWCIVDMLDATGAIQRLTIAHSDPSKLELARQLERKYPVDPHRGRGVAEVLRTGRSELYPVISDETLQEAAQDEEHLRLLRESAITSAMVVPLVARGRTLGAITFVAAESSQHYDEADLVFAEDLARRAALAVDNAGLYREARQAVRDKEGSAALLEAVLRQMPAGVIIAEAPSGRLILGNREGDNIMGFHPVGLGSVADYEAFSRFFPGTKPQEWPLLRTLETGELINGENLRFVRSDGAEGIMCANSAPVFNREGEMVAAVSTFYDITERIRAEKELRDTNSEITNILESITDAFVAFDFEFRFRYLNSAAERILGKSRKDLLGSTVYEAFDGFVGSVFDREYKRAMVHRIKTDFEAYYEPLGTWIEVHAYPAKAGLSVYFRNVTERRKSDEALRASNDRFTLAQKAANIATWDWNILTGDIAWSSNGANIYGAPEQSFQCGFNSWMEQVLIEDRERVKTALKEALAHGSEYATEFRIRRTDDQSVRWLASRGQVYRDDLGNPVRMLGVNIDVTESKRAEEALRVSEQTHRSLFETMTQGVIYQDGMGRVIAANPAAERILGFSLLDKRGRGPSGFRWKAIQENGSSFPSSMHPAMVALETGREVKDVIMGVYNPREEQYRWLKVDAVPQFRPGDKMPYQVYSIFDDITERKRAEEIMRVSEKLAATGRLAASIAHEINNPLESITNLLYLLENDPSLQQTPRHYAAMAQQELARVTHIARQTLGFYRDTTAPVPVNLPALLDNVLELYRRKIDSKRIQVKTDYEVERDIPAFPGELRQVFSNLVVNAIESVASGGIVRLHVFTSRDRNQHKRGVRVTIADTGPGIPLENRRKVFEPFFTTKGEKGTGLGLWVSQGIVQKHGGHIRFRSSTNNGRSGTVFSVFLPYRVMRAEIKAAA